MSTEPIYLVVDSGDVERQLGWPVATTRMAGWPSRPKHIEGAGSWGPRQAIVVVASTSPGGDRVGEWEGPARASGPVLTHREGRGSWWAGLKGALLLPWQNLGSALRFLSFVCRHRRRFPQTLKNPLSLSRG